MSIKEKQIINKLEKLLKKMKKPKRPFGIFISGGIDSALLAAILKPDIAITCRFPHGEKYDEYEYAMATIKHLKLYYAVLNFQEDDFKRNFEDAVKMYGKPTTHFSLVPLYLLFKAASLLGLKRVISGEGPDEYLGGYPSYGFILHEQKLYDQPELKNYKLAIDKYLGTPQERFAKILGKNLEEVEQHWNKYNNLLSKMGHTDLKLRGIEEMELKLAKESGIEFIYPYMSKEIEKFCFTKIPDEMKIKGFTTKWILRKIAEKYLPKKVVWRKNKMGGPVAPVGKWLGEENEFSKEKYLLEQDKILKNDKHNIRSSRTKQRKK